MRLICAVTMLVAISSVAGCATGPTGSYHDPFSYCAAVGTRDVSGPRYVGPAVPVAVAEGIMKAVGASDDAPLEVFTANTSWRCLDGQVLACTVGANLPCGAKADTGRESSPAARDYCRQHPEIDFIPAVVTGRETVFEWRCRAGSPTIERQVTQPDARGFPANIWHRIDPPR